MKGLFVYTEERSWKTQSSTVASLNIKSTRIIHSSPGHNMSSLTVHCPIVSSAYPFSNPGLDAVSNASVLFLGQPTMIVTLPPIAVIANISRPKHAVQQPASHPVGTVLARGVAPLEQRPRQGPGVPRDLHNAPALSLRTDMMPEKGWSSVGVISDTIQQIRGILVHSIVYDDSFILYILSILYIQYILAPAHRHMATYPHSSIILLMLGIMRIQPQRLHKLLL